MDLPRKTFPLWILILPQLGGCQLQAPPKGVLEESSADSSLSSPKLRTLVIDFAPRYMAQVEHTADYLLAHSTDGEVRKNALLWKSNGISACFRAACRQDPLAAYLDLWVLCAQTSQYFERTQAAPLFGNDQRLAIETAHSLERQLQDIRSKLGRDLPWPEDFATEYARRNPIESLYFERPSVVADYIEQVKLPSRELSEAVSGLTADLAELKRLSALYSEFLSKQVRWQAELLVINSTQLEPVARSLGSLVLACQAVDRMAQVAETTPEMVDRQRTALQKSVTQERIASFLELERMRAAMSADLQAERVAVMSQLAQERAAVCESMQRMTADAMKELNGLTERRTNDLYELTKQLIDHAFVRLHELLIPLALLGAALLLSGWFVLRRFPSRRALAALPLEPQTLSVFTDTDRPNSRAA